MNGFNLASHTTALEQSVLGKPHLLSTNHGPYCSLRASAASDTDPARMLRLCPPQPRQLLATRWSYPTTMNDGSESAFDSQTSVDEQTPSSRKTLCADGHKNGLVNWLGGKHDPIRNP